MNAVSKASEFQFQVADNPNIRTRKLETLRKIIAGVNDNGWNYRLVESASVATGSMAPADLPIVDIGKTFLIGTVGEVIQISAPTTRTIALRAWMYLNEQATLSATLKARVTRNAGSTSALSMGFFAYDVNDRYLGEVAVVTKDADWNTGDSWGVYRNDTTYAAVKTAYPDAVHIRAFFRHTGGFATMQVATFDQTGVYGILDISSAVAAAQAAMDAAEAAALAAGGYASVTQTYRDEAQGYASAAHADAVAAESSNIASGNSASASAGSASSALTQATNAAVSAAAALTSQTQAAVSATNASSSATTATTQASSATASASAASSSATTAATHASNASSSAAAAASSASTASTQASNASASASSASSSATTAASFSSAASSSATAAASSASTAATQASNASASASSASSSAGTAATHASNAATSASTAATQASNASSSASSASSSASTAATHASNASGSATAASSSASTATTQASNASASAASALSYATLAASIGPGALNANPRFSTYATTPGEPGSWVSWDYTGNGGAPTRVTGDLPGSYAVRESTGSGQNQGSVQSVSQCTALGGVKTGDYFVLEGSVKLVSGSLQGAGMHLQYRNSSNSVIDSDSLNFYTDKDSADTVVGAGTAGRTYRFSKLVQSTTSGVDNLVIYRMTGWTGFGTVAAKTIEWQECLVRPATAQEIAAGVALPALQATVTTQAGTLATHDGKLVAWLEEVVAAGSSVAALRLKSDNHAGSMLELQADAIRLGAANLPAMDVVGSTVYFRGKVNANSITATELATSTLITSSAQIGSGVIQSANIGSAEIKNANIDNLAVNTLKIADESATTQRSAFTGLGDLTLNFSLAYAATVAIIGSISVPHTGSVQRLEVDGAIVIGHSVAGGTVPCFIYRTDLAAGAHSTRIYGVGAEFNASLVVLVSYK